MSGIEAVLQENRKTSRPSGNQSTKTRKAVKQSRAQGSHLKKVRQIAETMVMRMRTCQEKHQYFTE
jgi:hypothetical protein